MGVDDEGTRDETTGQMLKIYFELFSLSWGGQKRQMIKKGKLTIVELIDNYDHKCLTIRSIFRLSRQLHYRMNL